MIVDMVVETEPGERPELVSFDLSGDLEMIVEVWWKLRRVDRERIMEYIGQCIDCVV